MYLVEQINKMELGLESMGAKTEGSTTRERSHNQGNYKADAHLQDPLIRKPKGRPEVNQKRNA